MGCCMSASQQGRGPNGERVPDHTIRRADVEASSRSSGAAEGATASRRMNARSENRRREPAAGGGGTGLRITYL